MRPDRPGSPFEGRALFAISVDEVGLVVNVQVAESTGDRHAWEDVGRRVLNSMAQKRVRVPPGAKGVAMKSYPALNHLFVAGEGKSLPAEYAKAGHVDGGVLEEIAGFVRRP